MRVAVPPEHYWGVDMGTAGSKRCYNGGIGLRGPKLSSLLETTGSVQDQQPKYSGPSNSWGLNCLGPFM